MLFTNVSQVAVLILLLIVGWLFGFASHPGGKRWKQAYREEAVGRAQDREELDAQLRDVDGRIAALTRDNDTLLARNAELTAELERARTAYPAASTEPTPSSHAPADPAATVPAPAAPAPAAAVIAQSAARPAFPRPAAMPEPAPEPVVIPPVSPVVAATPIAAAAPMPQETVEPIEPAQPARTVASEPVQPRPVGASDWLRPTEAQTQSQASDAPADAQPLPIKRGWFDWSRGDDLTRLRGVDEDLAARLKAEKVESFAELGGLSDEEEIALERRLDLPAGYLMKEQLREQARLLANGQSEEHAARFG